VHEHEILERLEKIMADLTVLNAAVADNTTAVAAVQAEVASLNAGTDQTAIDAAAAQIGTNNTALNALVPTPAAPVAAAPAETPTDPNTGGAVA
jgi:hypothetical protein